MATRADFERRLSGGASNTDPNLSLGGIMSSHQILTQSAVFAGSGITGVTLVDALGHNAGNFGNGTLTFLNASTTLSWAPFGGSSGSGVDVSVDDRYVIADSTGNKYLLVDVVSASLPGSDASDNVTIDELQNELFDDVSGAESAEGHIDYRCFYVTNIHSTDNIDNVRVYIENQPVGPDSLEIGLDPAGIGDGSTTGVATTIADEETAPGGVTFSTPSDLAGALLIGNLTPTDAQAVWVKRTTPVNTLVGETQDLSRIQFAVSFP